ncbi:hypothetical protein HNR53_000999 [Bacillus benzoevorans]|uniref:Uncharacterized protein n=1 Tax=Bacillus benzoevorans TaxID=1456 RepID=A0A7X0HPM7_9BACI|nr:hypothetical protein [Bacillus benzoevorans]
MKQSLERMKFVFSAIGVLVASGLVLSLGSLL